MTRSVVAAVLITLFAPAWAGAGTILGVVQAPGPPGVHGRGIPAVVVWLDEIPDKLERNLAKKAPREAVMEQGRHGFVPNVLAVAPGTVVRFENHDRRFHNVFSVTPGSKFDLGRYGPKRSVTVTLDHPDAVQLFCELHPAETGWIRVVPNHAFLQTDAHGAFRFPKLPKGDYTVRFWLPHYGMRKQEVELKHGDAVVALHF